MSEKEVKPSESPDKSEKDGEVKPTENGEAAEEKKVEKPPTEMRAVVLTSFGGLKSVKLQKKPEPTVNDGEVLINVKAWNVKHTFPTSDKWNGMIVKSKRLQTVTKFTEVKEKLNKEAGTKEETKRKVCLECFSGLNFQDLMVRVGAIDTPPRTPFILGLECAGEIAQVGNGVEDFQVGDRVVALLESKAWAEKVVAPAKYVYKIPNEMSFTDAAAITMNYVVAYILVFDLGSISSGKKVLLHSAGGSVGQSVVQLCRTMDDVEIFGIASKGKHEALKDSINHLLERGTDYVGEVRKLSPEGVDVVFDCICGDECNRGYNLLKPMGKYILFGSSNYVTGETKSFFNAAKSWWQVGKTSPLKLFYENKSLGGLNLRHLMYQQDGASYVRQIVGKVFDLWKENKIKPVIDSTWAWEDIPEAMQKLHDRKNIGKLILDPSLEPKPKPATPVKGKKGNSIDKEDKKKEEEPGNGVADQQPQGEAKENNAS